MTVPADAEIDSPTRATARDTASFARQARPQAFPDAEHEEQPVVGPGSEDENDQQQLGDLRDLETVRAELADERAGKLQDDRGGQQGDERRQHGTEDEQQQHDDEQDRQQLGLVARRARRLLLRDVGGHDTGQVELDVRGAPPAFANAAVSPLTTSAEGPGLNPAMFASTSSCTARPLAEVPTYCTAATFGTFLASAARRVIAWVSAALNGTVLAYADDDHRHERRLADQRRGKVAGDGARSTRGQERRVVVVDLACERGEEVNRRGRPDEPHDNDEPTKSHGEASKAIEEHVHTSQVSVSGLGGVGSAIGLRSRPPKHVQEEPSVRRTAPIGRDE